MASAKKRKDRGAGGNKIRKGAGGRLARKGAAQVRTGKGGMGKRTWMPAAKTPAGAGRVYTMDVFILDGPLPKEFGGKVISRTIQIMGRQTLEELHRVIFEAFGRHDAHFYEFNLGNGPDDRSRIYSVQGHREKGDAGDCSASIDSLGLKNGRAFGYLFDFGDCWLHQINVEAIEEVRGDDKYPRIVRRVGKSPPQYPDDEAL